MTVGSRTPATARSARGQVKCHRSAPCGAKSPPSQHHQPGGDECDPDEWRLQPTRGLAPGWIEHRVNGAPHLYAEVARLSELAAAQLSNPRGDGLRTVELAIRAAMLKLGGAPLEELLAVDTGHRGPRVACCQGHDAEFVSYRPKFLDTVLGEVKLQRAWYHCTSCRHGLAPRDRELDIAASSLSPGLRRMVARVGSQEPFAQGRRALAEDQRLGHVEFLALLLDDEIDRWQSRMPRPAASLRVSRNRRRSRSSTSPSTTWGLRGASRVGPSVRAGRGRDDGERELRSP